VLWGICICRCYRISTKCNSEKILKIGQYLVKLWARVRCLVFLLTVYIGFTFLVPTHTDSPEKGPLTGCLYVCVIVHVFGLVNACCYCAGFCSFHAKPRHWLGETTPCRVGRKTTTQSTTQTYFVFLVLWKASVTQYYFSMRLWQLVHALWPTLFAWTLIVQVGNCRCLHVTRRTGSKPSWCLQFWQQYPVISGTKVAAT